MKVRMIESSDNKQIKNLYHQLYPDFNGEIDLTNKTFKAEYLNLCAEEDANVVGFIIGIVFQYGRKKEAYLLDLVVDEEYRRQGIGAQLIKEFELRAKDFGAEWVFVDVDPDDKEEDPTPFYEKNGFQKRKHAGLVKKVVF